MKCFSADVCIYSIILRLSDCHDSTCAFLIVMLILIYALFYSTFDYFSVCVKCFNIDVRIYSFFYPFVVVVCFILAFLSF